MDKACARTDETLARYIPPWQKMGYETMITADHGQNERGHHGGRHPDQQDFALYYFGTAKTTLDHGTLLDQRQLAPTILNLLDVEIPKTMQQSIFLQR